MESLQPRLEDILITSELPVRRSRARNIEAENEAFRELARTLADQPKELLETLVAVAVRLCDAGSAGVSLLEEHTEAPSVFRWVALAGAFSGHVGGSTPSDFSPCGVCLQRGEAVLYDRPGRYFTYFTDVEPEIVEGLVIPFRGRGETLGTVWVVSHVDERRFTQIDLATMRALADFTAAGLSLVEGEHRALELAMREQRARREAEEATRAKDAFLSTVSHELRRPLGAIVGWAELLLDETLPQDDLRSAATAVYRNAEHQIRLVDDLLDAARVSSGTLRLQLSHVDLGRIVADAIHESEPAARLRGVTIQVHARVDGMIVVLGDPGRLQQMLGNLLSNAIKFSSPQQSICVDIEPREEDVIVRVSDAGEGIESDLLPHVFQRFRQGNRPSALAGLGLGLNIARQIAEQHGGHIAAESAGLNRGAVFTVTLPLPSYPGSLGSPELTAAGAIPRLDGIRVLIVDDDADAREAVRLTLRRFGATVVATESVATGLAAFDGAHFDILVTDLGMPHLDGYDLLKTIRTRPHGNRKRFPAVALTAYATERDRARAEQAGFELHLSKPVTARELVSSLADLVRRKTFP